MNTRKTSLVTRIRHAWAVLRGIACGFAWHATTDRDVAQYELICRIHFALRILDVPMAVIDDVTAAFGAYDTKIASAQAATANAAGPLQAQITELQAQLDAITAAAIAKAAELAAAA